jgi:hypothetical protein
MKVAFIVDASAFARSVLPVPGGPYSRTPFGALIPTRWKNSGFVRGSSMT